MPGILGGLVLIALPMFGDYYTPDLHFVVAADHDDRQPDRPRHPPRPEKPLGAALTVVLSLVLLVLMAYYLRQTHRAGKAIRA